MDDKTTTRPCDRHAWQPTALPDGRTAILCGKCGQHAVTLPAETVAPFLPPLPAIPQPYPAPIWVDPQFLRPYPPAPIYPGVPVVPTWPYTITFGTGTNAALPGSDAIPLT